MHPFQEEGRISGVKIEKDYLFRDNLLLGGHHDLGNLGHLRLRLLLLLLAGNESGGHEGDDSNLLHNDYLCFDVVLNDSGQDCPVIRQEIYHGILKLQA